MNSGDIALYKTLSEELDEFSKNKKELSILNDQMVKDVLIKQIIDSIRRVKYACTIAKKNITPTVASPVTASFNPIKAAVYHLNNGNIDEAAWLIFLSTHFGYSPSCKWLLSRDIYGKLGCDPYWDWVTISENMGDFKEWTRDIKNKIDILKPKRKFGNHRKYESLKFDTNRSLYNVVSTYVDSVLVYGNHQDLFLYALGENNNCEYGTFDFLYQYFDSVKSFGRTARFDFLSMLGKLNVVNIEPPKTYMKGATGPISGAKLLFFNDMKAPISAAELERLLFELNKALSINPFGMQVLEDSLCNWQKHPRKYVYFGG